MKLILLQQGILKCIMFTVKKIYKTTNEYLKDSALGILNKVTGAHLS